jgi:hypothetical protein
MASTVYIYIYIWGAFKKFPGCGYKSYYVKTMIYKLNRLQSISHLHAHTHTHTHTFVPSVCPVVVTLMKIFFFDHAQSCVGIFFDVFHHCKTTSLKAHFQHREVPEVTWCEAWGIGRVWHNRNVVSGQELLNCHSRVTGRVIMMQRPVVLPFLRLFSSNTFAQTRQNVHIESSSNTCPAGTNSRNHTAVPQH